MRRAWNTHDPAAVASIAGSITRFLCERKAACVDVARRHGNHLPGDRYTYGKIIVGGPGNNRYEDVDAAVILDLGGDDDYVFTHPETSIGKQPVQIIVDFAGDDVYQTQGVGGPGAGLLGISILIDRAGNDQYCQGLSPLFKPRANNRTTLLQPDPESVKTSLVPFPLLYGNPQNRKNRA